MMSASQQPEDKRTTEEILKEVEKIYPLNSYWYKKHDDSKHHEIYHWIYGYDVSDRKVNSDIRINSQIIEFSNEMWSMRKGHHRNP